MKTEIEYPQKTESEIQADCDAQVKLCKEKSLPDFAPKDGRCYSCRLNIYQNYGASKGASGTSFVTGCPHCHESYCE